MKKRIALLTSGGDAPGMNAAIRAVVRSGKLADFTILGIRSGFSGLIQGDFIPLDSRSVANIIQCGGTILKTSRCEEFKASNGLQKAKHQLEKQKIDVLIIIGGDGSFRGAMELSKIWNKQIIGIPGTIDNDLCGTDETIGFDTAINTALYAVDRIRDTADAHGRFFLIEVMGRLSGYIALHAGLAGGAEEVFIPEHTIDIDHLCTKLCEYRKQGKLSSIIVVAEGCRQGNSHSIAKKLEEKCGNPYRVVVLGHLLRGGAPTAKDRILGSRLGEYAISSIQQNRHCFMVGCINKSNVCTPLEESIKNKKNIDPYEYELLHRLS